MVLASSADEAEFKALRTALDAGDAIDAATFSGDGEASKPAPDLVQVARDELISAWAAEVYSGPGDLLAALDGSLLGKAKG